MAKRYKKPVLFIQTPAHVNHETAVKMLKEWEARRDFHFLVVATEKEDWEIKEFGAVTANGSDLRRLKEEILNKL